MTTDEMPPNAEAAKRLSCNLQQAAQAIREYLSELAGDKVEFILLAHTGGVLQYVSTIDRQQSMEMLTELFDHWKHSRADIPAHYNPDLQ